MRLVCLMPLLLCGCEATVVGCDFREGSPHGPEARCQDRTGVQSAALAEACELTLGVVHRDGCPLEEAVGGCDFGVDAGGGEIVDWYYPPMTAAAVALTCEDRGTMWVEP